MSEARIARPEDFDRHNISVPGGEGLCAADQRGGDGGTIFRDDAVPGGITRETLKEGLRLMSTPPDKPNPLLKMWEQAAKAEEQVPFKGILDGIVATGGYELIPTEFETKETFSIPMNPRKPGEIVLLPREFKVHFDLDLSGIEATVAKALAPFVGKTITEAVLKETQAATIAALREGLGQGFAASQSVPFDWCGTRPLPAGYDWKKEQQLMREEREFQEKMQAQLNEEMEQARMTDDGAKCHMNEEIRAKMREDRFYKQLRPIVPITNDELDRSVPTNLPVDPANDTPYQAFRRLRNLPDTTDSMEEFCKHARIYNQIARGTGGTPIPDDHVTTMEQLLLQARLSEKHAVPVTVEEKEKWGQFLERNVDPKGMMMEFFAYETVGVAPAHVAPVAKTDDPEVMKALGDAIEAGRVVMNGDSILSIDRELMCDPDKLSDEDKRLLLLNGWSDADFFRKKIEEGLGVPKSAFEDDVKPDAVVGN